MHIFLPDMRATEPSPRLSSNLEPDPDETQTTVVVEISQTTPTTSPSQAVPNHKSLIEALLGVALFCCRDTSLNRSPSHLSKSLDLHLVLGRSHFHDLPSCRNSATPIHPRAVVEVETPQPPFTANNGGIFPFPARNDEWKPLKLW